VTAAQRQQILYKAWCAAGRPARIVKTLDSKGVPKPCRYSAWQRNRTFVEASEAEVAAWRAWLTEKNRLIREIDGESAG
jgi:hypothetical protein